MGTAQLHLFDMGAFSDMEQALPPNNLPTGLLYLKNYISVAEEQLLINGIDNGLWLHDLKRRVQHYGYKYDYRLRRIDPTLKIGNLPDWLNVLAKRLKNEGHFDTLPDQVIVNEYLPGQGISPHIDCEPCFADTIASLSLGSTAIMEFTKDNIKVPCLLETRSMVILKDEARYEWQHCIPSRKKDAFGGKYYYRERRISLTFRKTVA